MLSSPLPLTSPPAAQPVTRPRRTRGFTLNEVLISLGILAVGITAVASLFPSAILMQKRAVQDALFQQNTRSAESFFKAKGIGAQQLFDFSDNAVVFKNSLDPRRLPAASAVAEPTLDVYALAEIDVDYELPSTATPMPANLPDTDMRKGSYGKTDSSGTFTAQTNYADSDSLLQFWPEADRSFPSVIIDPAERDFFYVPLFRRGPEATPYINDWVVYAFVMQAQPAVADPGPLQPKYPNAPDTAGYDNPISIPDGAVCANPFDDADYFPKVFRAPVTSRSAAFNGDTATIITFPAPWQVEQILRLGDLVLGDNGEVYRIGTITTASNSAQINLESRQTVDSIPVLSGDDLTAIWFAAPPNTPDTNPPSPIRDIRVLSRSTVRLEDYQ